LAAVPPLGTFVGFAVVDRASGGIGYHWLPPLLAVATAVTGAAVLRAAARIFLGLGPREDDLLVAAPRDEEADEGDRGAPRRGFLLWGPAVALLVAGLGLAFAPGTAGPAVQRLKLLHDGVVGEYVTWLTVGAAALTGLLALLAR